MACSLLAAVVCLLVNLGGAEDDQNSQCHLLLAKQQSPIASPFETILICHGGHFKVRTELYSYYKF